MSETITHDSKSVSLNEKDVIQWLKDNPDFFEHRPDVLEMLIKPPQKKDKKIADFQSYLIERLKADKQEVLATTQEIVETSRANMSNQSRMQRAVLRLLDAHNIDELIHALTIDIVNILSVDISALIVESNGHDIPHVDFSGVRVVPAGTIQTWLGDKDILLQDNISGIEAIYGGGARLVQSQLLMRITLSDDTPPALIAFGSRDSELFQEGLGTEHVRFLAKVIEKCLIRKLTA